MAVERLEAVPFVVVVSLKVFADAARRKKVKRLSFSTAEKKKRKKKKNEDTSLSLSLSLSEEDEDEDKDTNKRSLPSRPLFFFFFALCVGRGKKGRRGLSKGRRNEEKACGSLNVLFLSFFSSKVLKWLFFVAEKQL